jgi:thymidine kinase
MGNTDSKMNDQANSGRLHLFIGPMYAGKTSKLMDVYEDCVDNEEKCIILTHSSETRYSTDKISTHDQKQLPCFKYNNINDFISNCKDSIDKCSTILVDESQFFNDLINILPLVNTLNKKVFVFGLDGDFKRNKFGQILDLIPHCDTIEKLTANCNNCQNSAIFSHRTMDSSEQVLIGSNDAYQSLCRNCYNKYNKLNDILPDTSLITN